MSRLNTQDPEGIIQMDRTGRVLSQFRNVSEASTTLGIREEYIITAINDLRKRNTTGGFLFARTKNKKRKSLNRPAQSKLFLT